MSTAEQDPRPVEDTDTPDAVLTVDGLDVTVGHIGLIHDLQFAIAPGERVGLIGESGSGKSLTALSIMGLLPEGLTATGTIRLNGSEHNIVGAGEDELSRVRGRDVAMVFQEPMTALNPTMRVGDQIAESMLLHRTVPGRGAARARALELLDQVQLPDPEQVAHAYPHQLSGGQRQRVVLAIALANDPALLICDEPTTALDVTVQQTVLELIVRGVETRDAAMLFITHDLGVIANVCERVLVVYGGRIVEAGTVAEVFANPRHRYTAGLLDASDLTSTGGSRTLRTIRGTVPAAGRFPAGCVFRTRCDFADSTCEALPPWTGTHDAGYACFHPVGSATSTAPANDADSAPVPDGTRGEPALPVPPPGAVAYSPRANPTSGRANPAVGEDDSRRGSMVVQDVVRDFQRPRRRLFTPAPTVRALRGVSFAIEPGERFGIVGESGSGKSTLLRILAGVDQPTSGSVQIEGTEISRLPMRRLGFLRRCLQMVFQDPMSSLDPRMRVKDIVAEPIDAQGIRGPALAWGDSPAEAVATLLEQVGLRAEHARRYPHQFSGGQRQRISIARSLAPRPGILLADEPVSALDVSVRAQVLNLINELVDELDLTLVFVSHDLSVVRHVCDRVAVMKDGQIVELGPTEQVYTDPQHDYTRTLLAAVPDLQAALSGRSVIAQEFS
ncbi:MAG TPA: ABC transporter ATP-binding protein [Intrasporangiaceae bacterium]|nr:ABC transporter ATP-binding protein [Intrasporangiaceae bacterium]